VCTVDPANLGRVSTLYYHLAGATYRELWEAWILAESILAERAASNPDDAARMATMAPYLDDDDGDDLDDATGETETSLHEHIAFHHAVASLARNRVLEIALQTMGQIVSHHFVETDDPRQLRSMIQADHFQLARLINAGDAVEARALMHAHTRRVADVAGNNLGTLSDDFIEWQ
jgi:DNA-binding FadR family transcriptional regulator